MSLRLSQIAAWTGGQLIGADRDVDAVVHDSRRATPGALFVALPGERVDGHHFVAQPGIAAALVSRHVDCAVPQVLVADTLSALQALARAYLGTLDIKIAALTGSNGKTSTKELTASILRRLAATHATPGNYNNEIGVPLTVLGLDRTHRYAVVEMGAGKPDDIQPLTAIAPPDAAVVTNVGPAHLERLGSLSGVAATKGGIYRGLKPDGVAILNADEPFATTFEGDIGTRRILRFALDASADIRASDIQLGAGSRFRLDTPVGSADIVLPLPGRHNIANALAATGLAIALGANLDAVVGGLEAAGAIAGRQKRLAWRGGTIIDDSYNANPASLAAGIDTLALAPAPRILVLGDMKELGAAAASLHFESGVRARTAGIDALYALGELSAEAARGFGPGGVATSSVDELAAAIAARWTAGSTLLVKGSRSSRMERVLTALGVDEGGAH